jgi:hypothetical protein
MSFGTMILGIMTFGPVPPGGVGFGRLSFGMLARGGRHCLPSHVQPFFTHASARSSTGLGLLNFLPTLSVK